MFPHPTSNDNAMSTVPTGHPRHAFGLGLMLSYGTQVRNWMPTTHGPVPHEGLVSCYHRSSLLT